MIKQYFQNIKLASEALLNHCADMFIKGYKESIPVMEPWILSLYSLILEL